MVDINYRGKGLGTLMNKILNEVGFGLGLRLYETVNKRMSHLISLLFPQVK